MYFFSNFYSHWHVNLAPLPYHPHSLPYKLNTGLQSKEIRLGRPGIGMRHSTLLCIATAFHVFVLCLMPQNALALLRSTLNEKRNVDLAEFTIEAMSQARDDVIADVIAKAPSRDAMVSLSSTFSSMHKMQEDTLQHSPVDAACVILAPLAKSSNELMTAGVNVAQIKEDVFAQLTAVLIAIISTGYAMYVRKQTDGLSAREQRILLHDALYGMWYKLSAELAELELECKNRVYQSITSVPGVMLKASGSRPNTADGPAGRTDCGTQTNCAECSRPAAYSQASYFDQLYALQWYRGVLRKSVQRMFGMIRDVHSNIVANNSIDCLALAFPLPDVYQTHLLDIFSVLQSKYKNNPLIVVREAAYRFSLTALLGQIAECTIESRNTTDTSFSTKSVANCSSPTASVFVQDLRSLFATTQRRMNAFLLQFQLAVEKCIAAVNQVDIQFKGLGSLSNQLRCIAVQIQAIKHDNRRLKALSEQSFELLKHYTTGRASNCINDKHVCNRKRNEEDLLYSAVISVHVKAITQHFKRYCLNMIAYIILCAQKQIGEYLHTQSN